MKIQDALQRVSEIEEMLDRLVLTSRMMYDKDYHEYVLNFTASFEDEIEQDKELIDRDKKYLYLLINALYEDALENINFTSSK